MTNNLPKVLIGAPTAAAYAYCLQEYAARLKELSYANVDVMLVDNSEKEGYSDVIKKVGLKALRFPSFINDSRERLAASRNMLRDLFLKEKYEYFLSLEQDVIPPVDVIEKLLSHKKDVVSGVYCKPFTVKLKQNGKVIKEVKKIMPLLGGVIPGVESKMHLFSTDDVAEPQLVPIRFSGLGCVLIHHKVLEKIAFRVDKNIPCHDDLWFSKDVCSNKFEFFCDTNVKCKHMLKGKPDDVFADCKKSFNPKLLR